MKEIATGSIRKVYRDKNIFSMRIKNKIYYFYATKSMIKKFNRYLQVGRFVTFEYNSEPRIKFGMKIYRVENFLRILHQRHRTQEIFYDIEVIREGIKETLNQLDYKLFLDLEMNMHGYKFNKDFKQEIIQVGYVLFDDNNQVIESLNSYIKPVAHKITKRTKKFLKIDDKDVESGISYAEFYDLLKEIVEKYNPMIIVWGKNDILALNESYEINDVEQITRRDQFINLLQLHKNYFNLKNDLGLFNALKIYGEDFGDQSHDAYTDAVITSKIFYYFLEVCDGLEVEIPSNLV